MNIELNILRDSRGLYWIRPLDDVTRRICSVSEAIKCLKKTRRQVYRYLANGILINYGKFFGEWLIDYQSVESLRKTPMKIQPIPKKLKPLFPEYEIADINAGKDRVVVLGRILEVGSIRELKWLNSRYSANEIKEFIKHDASRLLSSRSLNFWSHFYKVTPKKVQFRENISWSY